jgi:hypothetical protein
MVQVKCLYKTYIPMIYNSKSLNLTHTHTHTHSLARSLSLSHTHRHTHTHRGYALHNICSPTCHYALNGHLPETETFPGPFSILSQADFTILKLFHLTNFTFWIITFYRHIYISTSEMNSSIPVVIEPVCIFMIHSSKTHFHTSSSP